MLDKEGKKFYESIRVLIVEDNKVDRKVLEYMLYEYASFLRSTASFQEAIDELAKNKFDVIILDLNLPDVSGPNTLIKLNESYPDTAIIVNTGAYDEESGLDALAKGAQDFLVKGKYSAYTLNKSIRYAMERKRLERRLKTAYEEIEKAQERLVYAEKMKVVGGIASGIAHEVKNPLSTIECGIAYLSENLNIEDANCKKVMNEIKYAIKKANSIISDLLDFSAIKKLNKQKTDLNAVIERTLSLLNHHIQKNNIILNTKLDPTIPMVTIDSNRIEQVLINLMLNAIKAMPDGGELFVKTISRELQENSEDTLLIDGTDYKPGDIIVIVTIEDTGCGIAEEDMDKLFQPFFTSSYNNDGIGLGLYVSRNIMELHHGIIRINNKEEGGVRAMLVFKI